MYLLPKIHKSLENPPGRPIISGCNGPTENLSKLFASWLQPSVENLKSFVKDSTHMLQLVNNWNLLYGPFPMLVTIDVVSLYTNIPHEELINSVKFYVEKRGSTESPPIETITKVIDHVFKKQCFQL